MSASAVAPDPLIPGAGEPGSEGTAAIGEVVVIEGQVEERTTSYREEWVSAPILLSESSWQSATIVTSWEAGPFPDPVVVSPPSREIFVETSRSYCVGEEVHVLHGPWQVVVRGLGARSGHQVLARWEVHRTWTEASANGAAGMTGPARVGASGRYALSASELRLRGASEVYYAGASELRFRGASELRFLGASELRLGGASELRFLGASERRIGGASEYRVGGASERRVGGASEYRVGGASEYRVGGASEQRLGGASEQRPPPSEHPYPDPGVLLGR
jgi:hypothetical protein